DTSAKFEQAKNSKDVEIWGKMAMAAQIPNPAKEQLEWVTGKLADPNLDSALRVEYESRQRSLIDSQIELLRKSEEMKASVSRVTGVKDPHMMPVTVEGPIGSHKEMVGINPMNGQEVFRAPLANSFTLNANFREEL